MPRDRSPCRRRRSPDRRTSLDYHKRHTAPPPSSASTLPPPSTATLSPPPSSTTSMPPPPSFLTRKAPPTPQPTVEELRTVWAERIKLLAAGVGNRQQFGKVEADIENTRKLMAASRFPSLPHEGNQRIEAELAKLEAKREDLKKKRDDCITQLSKTATWPAAPISDVEEGEFEKQQEMLKYVTELKEIAAEMNSRLIALRERTALETGRDSAMDVDPQQDGLARPPKRRRLSDPAPPESAHGPTVAEIEEMREKFEELEGRYSNFENDMTAHDADMKEEVVALLDSKLDELSKTSITAPAADAYTRVKDNIDTTGKEVEEIAKEVGGLVLQQDAHGKEIEVVKRGIEAAHTSLAQMQQQFQSYAEARERDRKTIHALDTAYEAYANNPPTIAQTSLTHDQLVQLLEEPLLDMVHANVQPVIEQLREHVQAMLSKQNTEVYKTLWDKLSLTLRMVETISQRIERAEQSGTRA